MRPPDDVRCVAQIAYLIGWRGPSELFSRERRHVDWEKGVLILEAGETKNMLSFSPETEEKLFLSNTAIASLLTIVDS